MGDAIKDGFKQAQVGAWFDNWVQRTFPGVISSAVNTAVAQWQKENPIPKAPTAPKAPVKPTAPPDERTPAGSNVDNSETTLNFYMDFGPGSPNELRDAERRIGFIVRQATQGRGRVIGRPNTLDRTRGKK
jgi:hypothetical protein